jgi:acid stress chaperone HdeA
MKLAQLFVVPSLALAFTIPAYTQSAGKSISPGKMKCSDFVVLDEAYKPVVIYWAAGVDKLGVRETDEIMVGDPGQPQPVAMEVTEECKKTPNTKVTEKISSMARQGKLSIVKSKHAAAAASSH